MFDLYTDEEKVDLAHNYVFQVVPVHQLRSLLEKCDVLGFIVLEFDM